MEEVKSYIQLAIDDVYSEISRSISQVFWWDMSEADLQYELLACILGSRVSHEVASAATNEIRKAGLIERIGESCSTEDYEGAVHEILSRPLYSSEWGFARKRYPFPKSKANYVSRTFWAIHSEGRSLRNQLQRTGNALEVRRSMIRTCIGIGPKQSSLFLRNIGFSDDLAVLDSHVLRFMRMAGLMEKNISAVPTLPAYEMHESKLLRYAELNGRSLGQLDLAIWVVMRVLSSEEVQR